MSTVKVKRRHTTGGTPSTVDGELSVNSFDKKIFIGNGSSAIELTNQVGYSTIATVGTITSGTWNGTAIGATYGGTGLTSYAAGDLIYSSATNTLSKLTKPASSTSLLQMTSAGVPSWVAMGTGIATFLTTPSSANLAAAITDETGTGKLVFDTSPTLVTPNIGAATATSISGTNLAINDVTNSVTTVGPNTSGNTYLTIDSNFGESVLAGGSLAAIIGNAGISLVDYGGGITLDSSTGFSIGDVSGVTSGEYLFIDPSGYTANFNGISVIAPSVSSTTFTSTVSGVDISYGFSATVTTTATTQISLVQLQKISYRGAKFIIQAVNTTGGKYQLTEINAIHDGNTTVSTATISDINIGGANATYTVDIGGGGNTNMRLRATPTSTQSTVFKVYIRDFSL